MAKQGLRLHAIVSYAFAALAVFLLATGIFPSIDIGPLKLTILALFSLVATTFQWARSPVVVDPRVGLLATFIPAVPLALAVFFLDGTAAGAHLLAATAFAFQSRRWLQASIESTREIRARWAEALEKRMPELATVFVDNDIQSEVTAGTLKEGHIFRLSPGQVIPADGMVTFGSSFVDESLVNGAEEELELKGMGSFVFAGSQNKNGSLLVRATAVGNQTFSARLADRIRAGAEFSFLRVLGTDAAFTALSAVVLAFAGPASALRVFLVASSTSCFAVLYAFEARLASTSALRRRLWTPGAMAKISGLGMLVAPAPSVVTEQRLKLAAVECTDRLTEDSALALLAPVARKLESQAAFAVLQELRARNIPLQQAEFFQIGDSGGTALVGGEEVGWVTVDTRSSNTGCTGTLEAFVREHQNAGDEICLLIREGTPKAAFAFRTEIVKGAKEAVAELSAISKPLLLVSQLHKSCVARLQTELGLEHAQGEAGATETEVLMDRLAKENLKPGWVQTTTFRPRKSAAVISLPLPGQSADLFLTRVELPFLAQAVYDGRRSYQRLRLGVAWMLSVQFGLLVLVLTADSRFASALHLGAMRGLSESALALAGILPGLVAVLLLRSQPLPESV